MQQVSQMPGTLGEWLHLLETRHAQVINLGMDRVRQAKDRLGLAFTCPVITVGGTNGKGSTCAMLESILQRAGYRVGVYTSPHFIDFNERLRLRGEIASDAVLVEAFVRVETACHDLALTYFEFTTLAIMDILSRAGLDVVILEVGLGGRLDAVNVVDADVAIVTSVDIDHTDYLGSTREAIGFEKAGIFRAGKAAICGDPLPPKSLIDHASAIGADLWLVGRDFNCQGDKQQWNYGGRTVRRHSLAYPGLRGANQLLNASAALAALEALRDVLPTSAQDVRTGLATVELPGRFQVLPGQPLVILDVAHNPHAAAVLAQNLDNMGYHPFTYAVFGSMLDKDIEGVLQHLKGKVDHWCMTDLPLPRAASAQQLRDKLLESGFAPDHRPEGERTVEMFTSPELAYKNALGRASENDRIVVFGSFLTVAGVLQARRPSFH